MLKAHSLKLAAVAFALCAAFVMLSPEAFAATLPVKASLIDHSSVMQLMSEAGIALAALRSKHDDLVSRAQAKQAEIKDGMSPEDVKRIEDEHATLVREIEGVKEDIRKAEQEERSNPAAVAAERARSAEITTLAQRHNMPADFAAKHIADGTSVEDVRKIVLDEVAKRAEQSRISPRATVLTDEGDTIRTAVETAILHRANPAAVRLDDAARSWRGMSLLEMGRVFVEETQGVKLRGLGKRELAGVLLGLDRRSGMMSTSDFPQLLANVASKRLRDGYGSARQTWRPFSRQSNAPDFKERAIVQLSGMPEFLKVKEGGEYQSAFLGESVEKYALATYGRIISITRQTLINDDLGAFDRLPTLFGRAAAELESDLVWGVLLNNPKMGDNVDLFHEDHGNLAASGGAPSEATVEAAEIAIGAQKDAAGKPLNLAPRFLAVSRKHKVGAQKLLTAVTASKTGDVNVYQNTMDLIVEDRLYNAGGACPWFIIGDPAQWDTIEYAYLEGEEGLYTEERMGFEVDGIQIKGRLDFAAKAIDHKAFYKNPGN